MVPSTDQTAGKLEESEASCRIGARGVSRTYGVVRANHDVTLTVRPRTVHAVVGENGAGKSTLMRMLYGLEQPDAGSIIINDVPTELSSARAAIKLGIGLVQQELAIIPGLSLLENLVLGAEPKRGLSVDWKSARDKGEELATSVGVDIDWDMDSAHAPIAIQQQVEILRLIYRGADVLILDEPTAVLAPAQAQELLRLLDSLRSAGRTVIFISHKLDEVVAIADDITVLRSGRTVANRERGSIGREGLAAFIIGDSSVSEQSISRGTPGRTVLTVQSLAAADDRGFERLSDVSLDVRAGEIVGVAAVAGNGQEELAEALIGIRRSTRGQATLSDGAGSGAQHELTSLDVRARRRLGVAYVSADRKREGLALELSLVENAMALADLKPVSMVGWLRPARVAARAKETLERATVRFGSPKDPASSLSGGNQQRVVIGRETLDSPTVLIASQPTRGVDIRGIGYVHELLRRSRDDGAGVLLFSEELDELIELSDRIIVLHRGRVAGEVQAGATRAEVGELMLGRHATVKEEGQ